MLFYKKLNASNSGFSLLELLVVITLIGIVGTTAYTLFNTSFRQYLDLQKDSMQFGDVALQSQRITNILRGLTDITEATNDSLTAYGYFSPNDTYVSLIKYYKNTENNKLFADVTPMTANPPIGSPITNQVRTYTIIDPFFNDDAVKTFEYLDSSTAVLAMPVNDLHTIKGIKVALAVPSYGPTANGSSTIISQVSLRNRKTNL
jgi:prepilin-type N-terminal cleavage/methylation domain-containing protein